MNRRFITFSKTVAVALSALVLVACGQSNEVSDEATTSTAAAFPVTIKNNGTDVVIAAQPSAIISLSPTATEMLFAMGAGPQVIAVDNQSTFPADAPVSELSGFTPNIEAIVAAKPDLVVVSNDIDNVISALQAANIPVLLESAAENLDGPA